MESVLEPVKKADLKSLARRELETLFEGEQEIRLQLQDELTQIKKQYNLLEESKLHIKGVFVRLKARLFGPSSEKSQNPTKPKPKRGRTSKPRAASPKKPSERYPNAPIIEKKLELDEPPECSQCSSKMVDSGLSEVSEYLTVVPRKYIITRQVRSKYKCTCCHSTIVTTPGEPRIKAGSSYSDELIIDVAVSKYCDLIPVERFAAMAGREGFEKLPANSLIEATHHLADYVTPAYDLLKKEIFSLDILRADETPHRMLEGDKKSKWYLWGFSGDKTSYFECHPSRSGDVAISILEKSKCSVLLTDDFSGYTRAIKVCNKAREKSKKKIIRAAFCNSHARRRFKESSLNFSEESQFYLDRYSLIYKLEKDKSLKPLQRRRQMEPLFKEMLTQGEKDLLKVSGKSALAMAIKYFTSNFEGLTLSLQNEKIPLDNNAQERNMRNPVIGRKTWYGTHSKRGAKTASKLFSLVESCKINKINPRTYFKALVATLHKGEPAFTPAEFQKSQMVNGVH